MYVIHDNQINQRSYVINNPDFYDPTSPSPPADLQAATAAIPSYRTISPHFHAAVSMQAAAGVDHKFGKHITGNLTYLYTRGIHQYLTNNITAPSFDPSTYTITGPLPSIYNYQFQSGGVYKQHELVASLGGQLHKLQFNARYNLNFAKSDTEGVNYFPSVSRNPKLDYGRSRFGVRNSFLLIATYKLPYRIVLSSFFATRSGVPYNLTIGSDLTGNNQNNARPTYGTCGAPEVVATKYGCLDADPVGKGEKIVPYGVGVGPANTASQVLITKVVGIGPREQVENGISGSHGGGEKVSQRGLGGSQPSMSLAAKTPRKYTLTLGLRVINVLNIVNLAPPNGVLNSSLFGSSQETAGGTYSRWTPGNRTMLLTAVLSF